MMLELFTHERAWFVTLTYDAEHLPADGSVCPRHAQLFLKRLRRLVEPDSLRFFLVGEYGEKKGRPHYHAMIYSGPRHASVFSKAWELGRVHVGDVNETTCSYVAGYCLKKWTKKDAPGLDGRHPEFTRMSLRPGLGAKFADVVLGKEMTTRYGARFIAQEADVPTVVRASGKVWPLGRYLRSRLRLAAGFVEGKQPVRARDRQYYRTLARFLNEGEARRERAKRERSKRVARLYASLERKRSYETQ